MSFLEPAGWFAVWFGLDQLFYGTRELAREYAFYRKMARADVVFAAYVEEVPRPADPNVPSSGGVRAPRRGSNAP